MSEKNNQEKKHPAPKVIRVEVSGVSKEEFLEAAHRSSRSFFIMLLILMALFCGIIMVASDNFSLPAFLGPIFIYLVLFVGYELYIHLSYKQQLQALEMVYEFNAKGWTLQVGDSRAEIDWRGTVKFAEGKHCLFLYNDDSHSSLIPRHCISDKDLQTVRSWFNKSRGESKDFIRARDRAERQEQKEKMRQNRKNNRFWGNGPAWGPWKR